MTTKKPFVRNPYNYDADQASFDSGLECKDKSLTQQHQREDADINTIVKRFGVTGLLPQAKAPPTYGDFDQVNDYREALDLINQARATFMALPADLRSRFDNDAAKFLDYCEDPANLADLEKMGLIKKEKADESTPKEPPTEVPAGTNDKTPAPADTGKT